MAPFVAVPVGAAGSDGEEQDTAGGSDPESTGDSIGPGAGLDGGGSCGASCGAV